jgi:hypothetical protein
MGKLKRGRKNQKSRLNPMGKSPNSTADQKKDENLRQSKILPLINKLTSKVPNEKAMALSAITVIAEDAKMRTILLKEKLIPIVLEQCLNDSNDEIVVESFGLLRNIAIEEGYDIITYLWRCDIWVTIEASLSKITHSFKYIHDPSSTTKNSDKTKLALLYDFTENIFSLIITLASGSQSIYDSIFEKMVLVLTLVLNLIKVQINPDTKVKFTSKLFNSCLEFIYEFSSESLEFVNKLISSEDFDLAAVSDYANNHSNRLSMAYVEGIKFNYNEIVSGGENQQALSGEILLKIFDLLHNIDLNKLVEDLIKGETKPIQKDTNPKDILKTLQDDSKLQAKSDLTCLEVSLDIITSTFEYLSVNETTPDHPIDLSNEILEILMSKIYPLLSELIKFELANNGVLLLLSKVSVSINNLTWLMLSNESIPTPWFDVCLQLWDLFIEVSSKLCDDETHKIILNILWGIAKCLGPEIRNKVQLELIQNLISKGQEIANNNNENDKDIDGKLELYLSIVGFVGSLAPIIGNTETTSAIGEFLMASLELCTCSNPVANEVVIETLNSIYDIFCDKNFDYDEPVFVQQQYLQRLIAVEPKIRAMYKKIDKNKYEQLKVKGEEAWTNLGRFIKYKESE